MAGDTGADHRPLTESTDRSPLMLEGRICKVSASMTDAAVGTFSPRLDSARATGASRQRCSCCAPGPKICLEGRCQYLGQPVSGGDREGHSALSTAQVAPTIVGRLGDLLDDRHTATTPFRLSLVRVQAGPPEKPVICRKTWSARRGPGLAPGPLCSNRAATRPLTYLSTSSRARAALCCMLGSTWL
jgi:hypothetical protein